VRKFTTRHPLVALLFGQLGGATSLRNIEATMASHHFSIAAIRTLAEEDAPPVLTL
jgi:uncharacterized protein DUF4372